MPEIMAEPPVRANRAPTRPKVGTPSAPAQPAKVTKEDTEATLLVRTIAAHINDLLNSALKSISAPAACPGPSLVALVLVENASHLMACLQAAHAGLPGTIEDLRAFATFAGGRTHREHPRPPFRRTPDFEGDLAATAGAVGATQAAR